MVRLHRGLPRPLDGYQGKPQTTIVVNKTKNNTIKSRCRAPHTASTVCATSNVMPTIFRAVMAWLGRVRFISFWNFYETPERPQCLFI